MGHPVYYMVLLDSLVGRAVGEELAELPVEREVCLGGRGAEQAEGARRRHVPLQGARQAVQRPVHQGCNGYNGECFHNVCEYTFALPGFRVK